MWSRWSRVQVPSATPSSAVKILATRRFPGPAWDELRDVEYDEGPLEVLRPDVEAAAKAGIETVCVLTGGWARQELLDAGASAVFESVDDLRNRLDETLLVG